MIKTKPLTIAVSKGKMLPDTIELFQRAGYNLPHFEEDRRLVVEDEENRFRFLLAKPADTAIYVEYGAADVGIAGLNTVLESQANVYQPMRLGFSHCRLSVALPCDFPDIPLRLRPMTRVATKYPRLARQYFLSRGLSVEIIALNGSIELAPATGLADLIVDVVQSGDTLSANDLEERHVILESEATLIINRASHKLRLPEISDLLTRLQPAVSKKTEFSSNGR